MNKALLTNVLIIFLITIAAFSVIKYVSTLKEKYDLLADLNQTKERVGALTNEKQNLLQSLEKEKEHGQKLTQENEVLKENLRAGKERMTKLFNDLAEAHKSFEDLNSQFSIAKAENQALLEQEDKLKAKLSQASEEQEALKSKFNSLIELKKAIRELKVRMRQSRFEKKPQGKLENLLEEKIVEGNHGYLLKDGKFTVPAKVRIEVVPAPSKE